MASISFVRGKWRALVRRKGFPERSQSFATHEDAQRWARAQESSADRGELGDPRQGAPTIDALILSYRDARADAGRPIAPKSNEHYQLLLLARHFAGVRLNALATPALVEFARRRRRGGCAPYTVAMDVSKLGTVLRYACSLEGRAYTDPIKAAMPTLRHLKLVGPGKPRERRPSASEWRRLMGFFEAMPTAVPMVEVAAFAAATAMRLGEVCRIRWDDYDARARTVWIRDRKDPREKEGNDMNVRLLFLAHEILERQPRTHEVIFPYRSPTVSDRWTEACQALAIEDLVFHDLRHEGISRMFEAGLSIPEVAAISGHKKWETLKRYTHLTPGKEGPRQRIDQALSWDQPADL